RAQGLRPLAVADLDLVPGLREQRRHGGTDVAGADDSDFHRSTMSRPREHRQCVPVKNLHYVLSPAGLPVRRENESLGGPPMRYALMIYAEPGLADRLSDEERD